MTETINTVTKTPRPLTHEEKLEEAFAIARHYELSYLATSIKNQWWPEPSDHELAAAKEFESIESNFDDPYYPMRQINKNFMVMIDYSRTLHDIHEPQLPFPQYHAINAWLALMIFG